MGEEMLKHSRKEETIRDIAIRKKTSIEEVTELFRKTERGRFSLKEISAEVSDEKALLLSFISLLELIRLGEYSATQETRDDIFIIKSVMIHS